MTLYTPVFKEGNIDLSEFDYPRWDANENDIKLKLAKRYVCFNRTSCALHTMRNGAKVKKDSSDDMFISFFDERFDPILPQEREIIKRKDWAEFETLMDEKLDILNHPIFEKMAEYIRENSKQQSDYLVVCSCGHKKPYSKSPYFQGYTKALKCPELKNAYDLVVLSNSGVIPINEGNDFSFCYPFRYYDWNHAKEEQKGIKQDVEDKMYFYIKEYIKSKSYKKIAISSRETYDSYIHIFNKLKNEFRDIEFMWVYDKDEIGKWIIETFGFKEGTPDFSMTETRSLCNPRMASKVLKFFYGFVPHVWQKHVKTSENNRKRNRISKQKLKNKKRMCKINEW